MSNGWVDFQAVKASVSLAEVLRHYGVEHLRGRRPGQLEGRCPIHGGQRTDAFQASLSKNAFHCFACQAHGNVLDFVAAMEHCSVRQAALRLAMWLPERSATRPMASLPAAGRTANWLGKNKGLNRPLSFVLRGVDNSHPYLGDRGIVPQTTALFGVGFYGGPGLMSGRIVIPIHDALGRLVAYVGRSVNGAVPKYHLPSGFLKSEVLFNFHRATAVSRPAAVVVEGYFDCLRVYQAGVRSVVALMGTALSEDGEKLLLQRFSRLLLMLDADAAGRRGAERIASRLAGKCSVRIVTVPAGKQPDQLDSEEICLLMGADLNQLR